MPFRNHLWKQQMQCLRTHLYFQLKNVYPIAGYYGVYAFSLFMQIDFFKNKYFLNNFYFFFINPVCV